ncbi:hypothetical protein AFLA_007257 [Aspergillus flavus NRRL3357]|nr:hypothetical protein AFLA_007257 [Aspergillus flavus NRRL3357]
MKRSGGSKYGILGPSSNNTNKCNSPDDVWTVVTPLGWLVVGLMAARIRSVIFEILGICGNQTANALIKH